MNVTITFANKVESYYTRADGSAALSKDVLELNADGSAAVLWSRLEFDRGGGDDGTKPRTERGFSREVLRLPPAAPPRRGRDRLLALGERCELSGELRDPSVRLCELRLGRRGAADEDIG